MKSLKTISFFVCVLLIFNSCKAPVYFIGMTEEKFLQKNKLKTVKATERESIYSKTNYPFGGSPQTKFFYFRNGKLVQVDEGVQRPDVIVEHR